MTELDTKEEFPPVLHAYICDRIEDEPMFAVDPDPKGTEDGLVAEYKLVRVRMKTTKEVVTFK